MADEGGSAAVPPEAAQSSSQGDEESELIEPATFAAANHRRNADIAAIMNAQAAFECPQGYERYPIAKRDANRSPIYTYGVRVVSTVWGHIPEFENVDQSFQQESCSRRHRTSRSRPAGDIAHELVFVYTTAQVCTS